MKIVPVELEGERTRLVPIEEGHFEELKRVYDDPRIWRWFVFTLTTDDDLAEYVNTALEAKNSGAELPFVTIDRQSGEIVGSTRFMNIDVHNARVEIGNTWISPRWQRTYINTEAKLLMLTHAFETWKCIRVEFKTDALNQQSRDALVRLGAIEEGVFRQHMTTDSERLRDSVYFSIIDSEWPTVKSRLQSKLTKK